MPPSQTPSTPPLVASARVEWYTVGMKTTEIPIMTERYTATVGAEALSPELLTATALPRNPISGVRYRVTIEPLEEISEEEAKKLDELRALLLKRRESVKAGHVVDGREMFARLRTKYNLINK